MYVFVMYHTKKNPADELGSLEK